MGAGFPADLEDATVIIGIVLKADFYLPYNSTFYTNPEVVYSRKKRSMSRWDLYGIMAQMTDT